MLLLLNFVCLNLFGASRIGKKFIAFFLNLIRGIAILFLHSDSFFFVNLFRFAVAIFLFLIIQVGKINVFVSVFFFPLIYFIQLELLQFFGQINKRKLAFHLEPKLPNYLERLQVLVLLNDDVFIFLVKQANGLLFLAFEEQADGLYGVVHLDDFVFAKMNEVAIVGGTYFQFVATHFALDFFAEMLVNPADFDNGQVPFNIAQNYKIVNSGISVLEVVSIQLLLGSILQLQKQQIFKDSNVLLVTVIRAPFVLALLFVYDLHLFLESDLFNNLFHLFGIVGFRPFGLKA